MRTFKQIPADKIGVVGWYMKGFEHQGILFMPPNEHHRAEALGAQCGNCHTIVWITGRDDPILNEPVPVEYSQDGEKYREYRKNKLKRFLASLLPCFLASLLPCFLASLLPCFLVSLPELRRSEL